ncbi:MAG: hypothetical protein IJP71_03020 [Lachnospiraceae bacterium]|nr:hypothetical protein [Lachnospiraceae bacterium]
MDCNFSCEENLFRAVYPPEIKSMYWNDDGTVAPAAFIDPKGKGLSVNRSGGRSDGEVVNSMKSFKGSIIKLNVGNCLTIGLYLAYKPNKGNIYHSEIYDNQNEKLISLGKRTKMAQFAEIVKN